MSIKNGFHYDDYKRRYYRDEDGDKIPENVCLCYAKEPGECCCDCTSWDDYVYDDWEEQEEWEKHREETYVGNYDE